MYFSISVFSGERLIQYATENLVTEVLIHPQTNTLLQCIRNLLASFTKHRHIIHAGYTFSGNGSWILQVRVIRITNIYILANYYNFVISNFPWYPDGSIDTVTIYYSNSI